MKPVEACCACALHVRSMVLDMGRPPVGAGAAEKPCAVHAALQAHSMMPDMPPVEAALLKSAMAGLFQNFLFAGVGGDMMQVPPAQILDSLEMLDSICTGMQKVQKASSCCASCLQACSRLAARMSGAPHTIHIATGF
jgi:hypothetical protein